MCVVEKSGGSLVLAARLSQTLGETLREVIEEEVRVCQERNEDTADYHSFLTHGTDQVFLSYRSMFHIAKHRHQIILAAEFDDAGAEVYREVKGNTEEEIILKTTDKIDLQSLLDQVSSGEAPAVINSGVVHHGITVRIKSILKNRPLKSANQDENYPSGFMPFYLSGTTKELHIDHILTRAPNITLSAGSVDLDLSPGSEPLTDQILAPGAILTIGSLHEAAMQPFGEKNDEVTSDNFFFNSGSKFEVRIWNDPRGPNESMLGLVKEVINTQQPIAMGTLTLKDDVVVDVEKLNRDPWKVSDETKVARWIERFDKIGKDVDGV
ncbi:hypothetical protein V8F06_013319 [Rhypophila decipiens]